MHKKEQGQSLVEIIVVVGVVGALVTGIISGTTSALNRTAHVRIRTAAVQYAQEGIEFARGLRDEGWDNFAALGQVQSIYCVGSDRVFQVTGTSCSAANINSTYTRSIKLQLLPASGTSVEKMSVTVTVSWAGDAASGNSVSFMTYLTQWR